VTEGNILDPRRQIKTTDLQVLGAKIVGGVELLQGQVTTTVAYIFLARSVAELSVRLRIYDSTGECAFASKLYRKGGFEQGNHRVDFHFIATMQKGKYAASFEFRDTSADSLTLAGEKNVLALHNLFVEFDVAGSEFDESTWSKIDGEFGYLRLPTEVTVISRTRDGFAKKASPALNLAAQFPWPLPEKRLGWDEMNSAMQNALHCSPKKRQSFNPIFELSTLSPTMSGYELNPTAPPMRTNVGQSSGTFLKTTGKAGFLLFGPYLSVKPGKYCVVINCTVGFGGATGVTIDVSAKMGSVSLATTILTPEDNDDLNITLEFKVIPPGYVDLEIRVRVSAENEIAIQSIVVSGTTSTLDTNLLENIRKNEKTFLSRVRADWLSSSDTWAAVYCPNLHWTPLIFALCDMLQKESIAWLLVVPDDLDQDLLPIREYPNRIRSIRLSDISSLPKQFSCQTIIAHSFGYQDETNALLKRFPNANFRIYADGFGNVAVNAMDQIAPIDAVYYFDGLPAKEFFPKEESAWLKYKEKSHTVSAASVFQYWKLLSENIPLKEANPALEPENYVVLYLRYWGTGIYESFTTEDIIKGIALTLLKQGVTEETVIIKSDPRVDPAVSELIISGLGKKGFKTLTAEDLLKNCDNDAEMANLPAEVLFNKGYLTKAKTHFVLDSTFGYSIALHPAICRPTKVVFGIHAIAMRTWEGSAGADQIYVNAECLAAMVLKSKAVGTVKALKGTTRSLKVIALLPPKPQSRR
jgi:hypothetical protein